MRWHHNGALGLLRDHSKVNMSPLVPRGRKAKVSSFNFQHWMWHHVKKTETYLCQLSTVDDFSVGRGDKPTRRRRDTEISDRMTLSRGLNSSSMSNTPYMPRSHHSFILHNPPASSRDRHGNEQTWKLCRPVRTLKSHQMRTATLLLI